LRSRSKAACFSRSSRCFNWADFRFSATSAACNISSKSYQQFIEIINGFRTDIHLEQMKEDDEEDNFEESLSLSLWRQISGSC
jgi:hypothetical protein